MKNHTEENQPGKLAKGPADEGAPLPWECCTAGGSPGRRGCLPEDPVPTLPQGHPRGMQGCVPLRQEGALFLVRQVLRSTHRGEGCRGCHHRRPPGPGSTAHLPPLASLAILSGLSSKHARHYPSPLRGKAALRVKGG